MTFKLTGKEIFEDKKEILLQEENYSLEKIDKTIILKFQTVLGDNIKMTFSSPKREEYADFCVEMWKAIGSNYSPISVEKICFIEPKYYWDIYKRTKYGKTILLGTGYIMTINGTPYSFPKPALYFNGAMQKANDDIRGVYSIKYQDKIIYIGSAANGIKARWKEHDKAFREKNTKINPMYGMEIGPNELEYEVIVADTELEEVLSQSSVSAWVLEFVEYLMIKVFQPIGNKQGVSKKFEFQATRDTLSQEVPMGLLSIVEHLLLEDSCMQNLKFVKDIEYLKGVLEEDK